MIVSVNWLKKYVDIDLSIDELAKLIGARLVEIEQVIELGNKYKDVVVARVVEANKLEGSDHLNVTKIDDGGVNKTVERDAKGLIQVVCGANNVRTGMLVAWLPPGSIVPETFSTKSPVTLTAKDLRGVVSNGMLASARELNLGDGHDGIIDITIDGVNPGDSFADVYELNDYLLDIENKSLTHRPDAFGIIGFVREVAGICGKDFHSPDWMLDLDAEISPMGVTVNAPKIVIEDSKLSGRYQGVVLDQAGASHSSNELTLIGSYIARCGIRPINPIVDVTNYLMLLTGQPLHAFDYDKLLAVAGENAEIHVRLAKSGETLKLLDGNVINLDSDDIVIADANQPLSLAGAMGGADTVIDDSTKRVFLESATFNLYNLRSTQMRHGIFSEAITRFTKGQPAALTAPVLGEAVKLLQSSADMEVISQVSEDYPGKLETASITVGLTQINDVLGTDYTSKQVVKVLESVEFGVNENSDELEVTVPYWRADIHIPEDIIEEIGRLIGYDNISATLPNRDFKGVDISDLDKLRTDIRQILLRGGVNEVLTYSFVHGDILRKVGQNPDDSYKIINSISPELQFYRQSLTPSLLQLVHPNIKSGYDDFALFELNKVHPKQLGMTDEDVPTEANSLALVIVSKKSNTGSAFYQAKNYASFLGKLLGLELSFATIDQNHEPWALAPFEHRRSASVTDINSGERLGVVGEYRHSVSRGFKLPEYSAGFEFDVDAILRASQQVKNNYKPSSRYPSTERDICFQLDVDVPYSDIHSATVGSLDKSGLEYLVEPIDIYELPDSDKKNVTVRIKLTSAERTLTGDEVTNVIDDTASEVCAAINAIVV